MMRYIILLLISFFASAAVAEMRVAATTTSLGMLAREVGGSAVQVTELSPPDRDAHFLSARPSIMSGLRRADLLVSVGAELEVGWLPAAIRGANNRDVYPGRPGFFESAQYVDLIEVGAPADRALGDVHPEGNPHFNLDPLRMAGLALSLAERMATLDPANADYFRENAARFGQRVEQRMPEWNTRAASAVGLLQYHKDANYLAERFGITMVGFIEPLPGVPPTARHLRDLVAQLRSLDQGLITYMVFQPDRGPRFMAENLGWPLREMNLEPPLGATAEEYFSLIDSWIDAVTLEST